MSMNILFGAKLDSDKAKKQLETDLKSLTKSLGLEIDNVDLKNSDKITSQIQKQIDKLSKDISLNISKINLEGNKNALGDIQKQINTALKGENLNLKVNGNLKEVSGELDVLNDKIKTSSLNQEQYLTRLENKLNRIKQVSESQHVKNENYDNTRDLNSIANIQSRINDIKSKNIRLSQEEKNLMSQQVLELDNYIRKETSKSAEINRTNSFLTSQLRSLESLKTRVNSSGGNKSEQARISSELERQINLYEKMINENKILGAVERGRIQKSTNDLKVQTNELARYENQFVNFVGKTKQYFLGDNLLFTGFNILKQSFNDVLQVSNSMRDLKKVSSETSEEYANFEKQANETARSLTTTTTEYINAVTAWRQAGESFQDAQTLARNSIIFKNVGDLKSDEEANRGLISTMKAFGMTAKDSMSIIDKLNSTSNSYAVTVSSLNNALMRGGSSLAVNKNSLSESIAIITAGDEVLQTGGERMGNSVKSIAMNLAKMKNTAQGVKPELQSLINTVTKGKVSLTDANGQMRSTYDILLDLGKIWKDLSANQKALLGQEIAGKYQVTKCFARREICV